MWDWKPKLLWTSELSPLIRYSRWLGSNPKIAPDIIACATSQGKRGLGGLWWPPRCVCGLGKVSSPSQHLLLCIGGSSTARATSTTFFLRETGEIPARLSNISKFPRCEGWRERQDSPQRTPHLSEQWGFFLPVTIA